ncbi:VOC family protein [Patulibacter sp. NPDC049589]|uniref:VOC family protein n=1 Tax=Patulibacter sp. NPDC049589 TaxID=3154731 RepID=UPI003417BF59
MSPAAVRPQPLLAVRDVARSSAWFCALLGATSGHGGDEYEQVLVDGELVLQLHDRAVDHHHGPLVEPGVIVGGGVAVWFAIVAFDDAVDRSRELDAVVEADVHENPNARQRELWLRDPDGYLVVVAEAR